MKVRERVLMALKDSKPLTNGKLSKKVDANLKKLKPVLKELEAEGYIIRTDKGKYTLIESMGIVRGRLDVKRGGYGFVCAPDGDIFVSASDMKGAYNGDTVLVERYAHAYGRKRAEGKILRVVNKTHTAVGTISKVGNSVVVACDDTTIPDIQVNKKYFSSVKSNQRVVVKVKSNAEMPEGKIVEVLGEKGEPGVDVLSVARSFGLTTEFPKNVAAKAASIPQKVGSAELKSRETLFDLAVFTIDGADTKDIDDAISLQTKKNGNVILGVHIADVSHYVDLEKELDLEARKRGTSVYLVDRVIPMLPCELSNGICSLNPGEIRLTLSCFMEITPTGMIIDHRISKTAIRSKYKMTYNDVNEILEDSDVAGGLEDRKTLLSKYSSIIPTLRQMMDLALVLSDERTKKGSINFDIDEAKIELDENGKSKHVALRERRIAERIIEEFMIACNNTIASRFFKKELPFVYRIHEEPDVEKLRELATFLSTFGYKLDGNAITSKVLQNVLAECEGTPSENIINRVLLRTLKKAKYSVENKGHFGLASEAYTHFTSPIRRYSDLTVHRIIKAFIDPKSTKKDIKSVTAKLGEIAAHTSARERNAIEAERRVDDVKKAEYMTTLVGKQFDGVISGLAQTALFVELPNTVEGVIPLSTLRDDYYTHISEHYCIIGERTKRRFNLGDKVRILVKDANPDTARVEFRLIMKNHNDSPGRVIPLKNKKPISKRR